MDLIDTHAHVFLSEFSDDLHEIISRSKNAGIKKIYMPNIDSTTLESMMEVSARYDDICHPMIGLHPCSVNENFEKELEWITSYIGKYKFYGIGETGTDLYWDKSFFRQQEIALEFQVNMAIQYNLPLILHSRNSMNETIQIIKKHAGPGLKGIFHCFSGTLKQAKEIIEMNFMLGIGGIITFKNSDLPEIIREIDLQHIVLETDSPYLSPAPERGKRNDPSKLIYINRKLAEIKSIPVSESAGITSDNALTMFGN